MNGLALRLIESVNPGCVWFLGAASELVAAGLCEDAELPGQPGRRKTSVTWRSRNGRKRIIVRRGSGRFHVMLSSEEILARRDAASLAFVAGLIEESQNGQEG